MKLIKILGVSQRLITFILICPLFLVLSCSNTNQPYLSKYLNINGFQKGDSIVVSEHDWLINIDSLNSSDFAIYYLDIDTLDYSVFNEDQSELWADSSGRIDTSKVGYVLTKTMLSIDSEYLADNRYYFCTESSYLIDKNDVEVNAYCNFGNNIGIIYYNDKFGFIAHYAYEWDKIILLTSIDNKELDTEYQMLLTALSRDTEFFPIPLRMRDILSSQSK